MLIGKSFKILFLILAGTALLAGVLVFQQKADAFSLSTGANISVVFTPPVSPTPLPWTLKDKIAEAKTLLAGTTLNVGTTNITYTEDRISSTSVSKKTLKDPQREVALAVLNTDTGDLQKVIITQHGADL